jgi:hypothetical protein
MPAVVGGEGAMTRIAPVLLIAAVLWPSGAATPARAQAQSPCAAYPPGSPAYAACRQRADQEQTDSFWWHEMDRRRRDEYRAGE